MTDGKSFVFRFGDVEVREREFILVKSGEVLPIEPKAFRVLLFLLHNPQKLITKEDLLNAIWGDAAVTESSLTRSIAKLRRALGDDFQEPRYIATVTTLGYRFVSPVEVSEEANGGNGGETVQRGLETADVVAHARPRDRAVWRTRRWWLIAAAVLIAGPGVGIWYLRRPLPQPRITKYEQITHDGHQKGPAGTDGSRVYLGYGPPNTVAQVAISGGEIVPIPVAVPFVSSLDDVSPDGSNILVESIENDFPTIPRALWVVHIPGGPIRRLGDGFGSAFSPDGTSVAYSTAKDIYLVRSDGTAARKLASVGGTAWNLAWSPDGGVIRFDRGDKHWQMSSDGSNLHEWLPGWHASSWRCCGRWTPDGRFYVFLSGVSDTEGQIWALDERRGMFRHPPAEPVQLTAGPILWSPPIPGKDGKTIFSDGMTLRGELSRFDPQTKQLQPYLGGISARFVSFSPDGQSVAYVTFPEEILWKANRDGSHPMQLSDRGSIAFMPRWSPDGTRILFSYIWSSDITSSEAYIVSARGGAPRKLLPEGTGVPVQSDPDWSPDGHRVVFGSSWGGQDPKSVIRIFDLDSRQITILPGSAGMTDPRWSPDGRSIAANSFDLATMNIFDVGTQRWSALPPKFLMSCPEWSKDSHYIYVIHGPDDRGVYRMRVKGGELEKVVDLKNWPVMGPGSVGWMGLDPTEAPLLLRDISSNDIYALTLEQK